MLIAATMPKNAVLARASKLAAAIRSISATAEPGAVVQFPTDALFRGARSSVILRFRVHRAYAVCDAAQEILADSPAALAFHAVFRRQMLNSAVARFIAMHDHLPKQRSPAWLASRITEPHVGGSEVATVMGLNPYKKWEEMLLEKATAALPEPTPDDVPPASFGGIACHWGTLFEPVIEAHVARECGAPVLATDLGSVPGQRDHRYSADGIGVFDFWMHAETAVSVVLPVASPVPARRSREPVDAIDFGDIEIPGLGRVSLGGTAPELHSVSTPTLAPSQPAATAPVLEQVCEVALVGSACPPGAKRRTMCALLEFKCPFRRFPKAEVPVHYRPQVLMGLDTVTPAEIGVFVEAVYRKCEWNDLGFSPEIDRRYHGRAGLKRWPSALTWGAIAVWAPAADLRARGEAWGAVEDVLGSAVVFEHAGAWVVPENYDWRPVVAKWGPVDLGDTPSWVFGNNGNGGVMALIDAGVCVGQPGRSVFPGDAPIEPDELWANPPAGDWIPFGVIPWKMMEIAYHPVLPEPHFVSEAAERIADTIALVHECRATSDPAEAAARISADHEYKI